MTHRILFFTIVIISNLFTNGMLYGQVAVALDASTDNSTVTGLSFTITDDNPNQAYSPYTDYKVTFCSGTTQNMDLEFINFSLYLSDKVYVYDGPSVASPEFTGSPFNGNDIPPILSSTGTCITVRFNVSFTSNEKYNGFAGTITAGCLNSALPAITDVTVSQLGVSTIGFVNGGVEGAVGFSVSAPGWDMVDYNDAVCVSNISFGATTDLHDVNSTVGSARAYSGSTYQSGKHIVKSSGSIWHEGIQQTVGGLTIGDTYFISFYQCVDNHYNPDNDVGGWKIYLEDSLVAEPAESTNTIDQYNKNPEWEQRTISFTATATSHLIKFMAWDDDANPNLRMGIDEIKFTTDSCISTPTYDVTFEGVGGWPGYTYDIGSGAQASGTFTGLTTGTYSCTVTDHCGATFVKPYIVADNFCSVLPVELSSFEAQCNDGLAELNWTTASEINNDYFTIERSSDAVNFESIATVNGNGNSATIINYSWTDDNPINETAYYRLKQTDFNGAVEYHGIKSTNCEQSNNISIYPNPFENSFRVQLSSSTTYPITIEVMDYLGRTVHSQKIESATTEITLNEKIATGTYFVKVFNETTQIVERILKTN